MEDADGANANGTKTIYPMAAIARAAFAKRRNMLDLLPTKPLPDGIAKIGHTRRGIYLISDPALVRDIMLKRVEEFPKNDLFNAALAPLIGDGVFIADGLEWKSQRQHLDPAIRYLKSPVAKQHIVDAAKAGHKDVLASKAAVDLGQLFSQITADVMHRLLFGKPLNWQTGQVLFSAFSDFQHSVATLNLKTILLQRAFEQVKQPSIATKAALSIRSYLQTEFRHLGGKETLASLIGDHAPSALSKHEREVWCLNQIAVFFLAGHETTASTLTWAAIEMARQPKWSSQWRDDSDGFRMAFIKEVMRLYPSGVFLPRVARQETDLRGHRLPRGAMLLISPWTIHRNPTAWLSPQTFDPKRFFKGAAPVVPGSYLPFGMGARTCIGGAFSFLEADIILSEFLKNQDWSIADVHKVRPFAGLTLTTAHPVWAEKRPLKRKNT